VFISNLCAAHSTDRKIWVHNVDLSTILDNAPGDTNTTAAVEVDAEDDGKVDDGDVSDDTEDGLGSGANSAISGSPVTAVPPVVAAVGITDPQAGWDLGPTGDGNSVLVSNEASGVLADIDIEKSELPVDGKRYLLWPFSISVSLYFFGSCQEGPRVCCTNPRPRRR